MKMKMKLYYFAGFDFIVGGVAGTVGGATGNMNLLILGFSIMFIGWISFVASLINP